MKASRAIVKVFCCSAIWALSTLAASAHGYLVASFPAAKTHLAQSPHHIKLLFSLRTDPGYSIVVLQRDDGAVLASKAQPRVSRSFEMESPTLPPGRYQVAYRMLSPDGDLMRGRVEFVVDE